MLKAMERFLTFGVLCRVPRNSPPVYRTSNFSNNQYRVTVLSESLYQINGPKPNLVPDYDFSIPGGMLNYIIMIPISFLEPLSLLINNLEERGLLRTWLF